MAKKRVRRNDPATGNGGNGGNGDQADRVMELIREGTALQVELLGAAARVWSEIVDRVANYNRELTNELMEFSGGKRDANKSLDNLVQVGKKHVQQLMELPGQIGDGFEARVSRRAGRAGHPKA